MRGQGAGHRGEGRHPARQPRGRRPGRQQGGRARGPGHGRQGDRLRRHAALDARQLARVAVGPRRPHAAGHRDRRQARRDHGPQGRGRLGHPLRRPPARPARGASAGVQKPILVHAILETALGVANVEEIACAEPAHAGHELRPRRPRRLAPHEDDARRRRPPRLLSIERPRADDERATSRARPRHRAAGPVALLDRPHGRRLRERRASCRSTARSATSRTSPAARRSSAPPSCSAASAPGRCTRSRSTSPRRSSRPTPTR